MSNWLVYAKVDGETRSIHEWAGRRDVAKRHGLIDFENIYPFSEIEFIKVVKES